MSSIRRKDRELLIKEFGHIPTKEELYVKIRESQERFMRALEGAWETVPDDPKVRKELLRIVEKAAKLRQRIYREVLHEKPNSSS